MEQWWLCYQDKEWRPWWWRDDFSICRAHAPSCATNGSPEPIAHTNYYACNGIAMIRRRRCLEKERSKKWRGCRRQMQDIIFLSLHVLFSRRSVGPISPYRPNFPPRPPPDYSWSGMTWIWLKCGTDFKRNCKHWTAFLAKSWCIFKRDASPSTANCFLDVFFHHRRWSSTQLGWR